MLVSELVAKLLAMPQDQNVYIFHPVQEYCIPDTDNTVEFCEDSEENSYVVVNVDDDPDYGAVS